MAKKNEGVSSGTQEVPILSEQEYNKDKKNFLEEANKPSKETSRIVQEEVQKSRKSMVQTWIIAEIFVLAIIGALVYYHLESQGSKLQYLEQQQNQLQKQHQEHEKKLGAIREHNQQLKRNVKHLSYAPVSPLLEAYLAVQKDREKIEPLCRKFANWPKTTVRHLLALSYLHHKLENAALAKLVLGQASEMANTKLQEGQILAMEALLEIEDQPEASKQKISRAIKQNRNDLETLLIVHTYAQSTNAKRLNRKVASQVGKLMYRQLMASH